MDVQQTPFRVVIVGGGFGGLEAALYLRRRLGDEAAVTLLADRAHFVFVPYLSFLPFGLEPEQAQVDLQALARARGFTFRQGRVQRLHPQAHTLDVGGETLAYDVLILATGARPGPPTLPGLGDHALTVWREADMRRLRTAFQHLRRDVQAGHRRRVVFLVPPGCAWTGPLYEMASMLETWLRWNGVRAGVDLVFSSPEQTYLEALGPHPHPVLTDAFAQRGIAGRLGHTVRQIEPTFLLDADGERIPYDLLIATAPYQAAVTWAALPHDAQGFVQTLAPTRQVVGHPDVYAVGDGADHPVKQAYLALLQADAAAEAIAARVQGTAPAFTFDPQARWLMELLDQGLAVSEAPAAAEPVQHIPEGPFHRAMLSAELPHQYGANPLFAGLFWKGTQVGLKVLQQLLMQQEDDA